MKALVKVMIALAVIFAGSVGTVSASQDSLPGSPLYTMKIGLENWKLNRADTPAETVELAMALSQERVDEIASLVEKGEEVPSDVVERYGQHVNLAMKACGELEEPAKNQLKEEIAQKLGDQVQVMQKAQVKNAGEDQQLQNMFQVMEQAGNMVQEGAANQYAGEDTPGVTTKCQGDECEPVGPNAGPGEAQVNGPGTPNAEPGSGNEDAQGPHNEDQEPGNEDPGQIQDGNNGGEHQGDIGNVNGNGNDNDNPGGNDTQGGQNGGDNGGGDNGGTNGGDNGGGN